MYRGGLSPGDHVSEKPLKKETVTPEKAWRHKKMERKIPLHLLYQIPKDFQ